MNSDCAFRIGAAHAVCQDYAVARSGVPAYAILADGCSSSPDTDIGARLLVKAAQTVITTLTRDFGQDPDAALSHYYTATLAKARALARRLPLERECLDATLLTVLADRSHWSAAVYGDGVVAARRKDGLLEATAITYADHSPRYLNYRGDAERTLAFEARRDTERTVERLLIAPDGTLCDACVREDEGGGLYYEAGSVKEYDWVAVLSDGVTSVTAQADAAGEAERMSLPAVLSALTAFKSTTGWFVQRRLRKFEQEMDRRRRRHHDDLTLAVIALEAQV